MKTDPAYAEDFRERQRIWAAGKRIERGAKQVSKPLPGYGELLSPEPLKKWFEKKLSNGYAGDQALLARRCGISERSIYRVLMGEMERITEDFADKVLVNEGSEDLWAIYPELYDLST
jgi:hypothetical protein